MLNEKRALIVAAIALAASLTASPSVAGSEMEIRRGSTVIAKGNDEHLSGTAMWCVKGNNGMGLVPYYFTKTRDFTKDVNVYERMDRGANEHVYTIKPNGDIVQPTSTGYRRGKIEYTVSGGGTIYKATFKDAKGNPKGYAYWSPVSAGFYDMTDKKIGTFGSGADGDMRMLAFFFFFIAPTDCR